MQMNINNIGVLLLLGMALAEDYNSPLTLQPFIGDPSLDPTCPSQNEIYPCVCYIVDDHLMNLDCPGEVNDEGLARIFTSKFPDNSFQKVRFVGNTDIQVLRQNVFDAIVIEEFFFRRGNLRELEGGFMESSFRTTTKLDLAENNINYFPFGDLPKFTALKELFLSDNQIDGFPVLESFTLERLSLSYNPIGVLPLDAFRNLPSLVTIDLDHTLLSFLHPGTFSGLRSLSYLFLGANRISQLSRGDLEVNSPNISVISLGSNQLTELNPLALRDLPPGASIYLDNNNIEVLEELTYKPLLESKVNIWLTNNPLKCDCSMKWLFEKEEIMKYLMMAVCVGGTEVSTLRKEDFQLCQLNDGDEAY